MVLGRVLLRTAGDTEDVAMCPTWAKHCPSTSRHQPARPGVLLPLQWCVIPSAQHLQAKSRGLSSLDPVNTAVYNC